jgi:hypothetical protein
MLLNRGLAAMSGYNIMSPKSENQHSDPDSRARESGSADPFCDAL